MPALSSAIQIARDLSASDSNGLTDSLSIDFSNAASAKMRKMLIDKGVDASPVQEATRNITDGVGTYLYPTDMFYVPKYIEVDWTDNPPSSTSVNWKQADKVKESNIPPNTGVTWLRNNQSSLNPLVDYRGDYFEIFPTPKASFWGGASGSSLTGALRIFYYLQNTVYTATTDTMNYPESLDYFSFGECIKTLYLYSLEKINKEDMEKIFQYEVGKLISITEGDGPSPTRPKPVQITGWEF